MTFKVYPFGMLIVVLLLLLLLGGMRNKPCECNVVSRFYLHRKLVWKNEPGRHHDIFTKGVRNQITDEETGKVFFWDSVSYTTK